MSLFRLSAVLFVVALAGEACTCARTPVKESLKADGEACAADEECESSLCDKLPGKASVCFRKCSTGCKTGEICTALAVNDRYACVPERPGLCQPCALNVDCPYPGDRCMEIDGTKVCARDCSFDGQCPSSYRCADGTDTNGDYVTKQCQPTSGTCNCTAASAGQSMPCSETNSFGTCMGVRTCRPPAGYEACTAPVPTTESCNGRDDDCNGMTDENLGETTCGTGECRRTVTNCVSGVPQSCEPLPPGTETCDNRDNDCDGVVDDGFDKMTSLDHCGACNTPCVRANATPLCTGGMCGIGMCNPGWVNADGIDANGCELACTPTGAEVCDGMDNDCDGQTDEGFSLATDVNNCGQCGRRCNVNNGNIATYACVAGVCGIATCTMGFDDCDQQYSSGCEKNTATDLANCGACNSPCATANATPLCASGQCTVGMCNPGYGNCDNMASNGCEVFLPTNENHCGTCGNACPARTNADRTCSMGGCGYQCQNGWVDLDGQALNGCEYQCTVTGADTPDLLFLDSNCDSIDGDASQAIFVAPPPLGNNANAGTSRSAPKATIGDAITAANGFNPKRAVYVSKGTYAESVTMMPGVSVYGGYDAMNGWQRAATNATIINSPSRVGVLAQNISLTTELQLVEVIAADATGVEANGDGRSSIGIHVVNSMGGFTVRACKVTAGRGSAGAAGSPGAAGTPGSPGGPAGVGGVANLGPGGGSSCNAPGGNGGQGVSGETNGNVGTIGTQAPGGGSAGNPGSGGARGGCNLTSSSNGFPAPAVTAGGGGGSQGPNALASTPLGSIVGGVYVPASGLSGAAGRPGGGGGGGGSGGGTAVGTNLICSNCSPVTSGGGGGGGGGGCGGAGGAGGRGGGGSFAVLIVNSVATVTASELTAQLGGAGGNGGNGGGGGAGGPGGSGSAGQTRNECTTRSGGRGADGAAGGSGGQGGGGSGGAGGPSAGIAYVGPAPTNTGNTVSVPGQGAAGGLGGTNGLGPAATGPLGVSAQVQPL